MGSWVRNTLLQSASVRGAVMQGFASGCATGASGLAVCWQRVAGALVLTLAVSDCSSTSQSPFFADAGGVAVALESIDGPPPSVFHKFVRDLNEEAAAHQIAVAPRGGPAPYRLRGYLAAHAEGGATSIAWAWDIYDATERRAFRLQGQERVVAGRKSWAAADDEVLRRIARASMEQVAAFIVSARAPGGPAIEVAAMPVERGQSLFAHFDDFRPEAAGIFRVFRSELAPLVDEADAIGNDARPADIPLPRFRPAPIGVTPAFAFANPNQ
jgi:hypothetical protein